MRSAVRMNQVIDILRNYDFTVPLSVHLKQYFKSNKKIGSSDRKILRALVYHYFRLGKAQDHWNYKEGIVYGHFICQTEPDEFITHWLPQLTPFNPDDTKKNRQAKWEMLQSLLPWLTFEKVFPFKAWLSEKVDFPTYTKSLFEQPSVYFYAFSNHVKPLVDVLKDRNTPFTQFKDNCFSVPAETGLNEIEEASNESLIVQDISVQEAIQDLKPSENEKWWDACAGAGGKSILLKYQQPNLKIWLSDNRGSMLKNLEERFQKLGLTHYQTHKWDLVQEKPTFIPEPMNGIILDVPCSGSGTWARTPERIFTVNKSDLKAFQEKQIRLAESTYTYLEKGGLLIYLTCSVFRTENEEVVNELSNKAELEWLSSDYFLGCKRKAETIFRAILRKK